MNVKLYAKHPDDYAVLDPWTVIHFSSGLATGLAEVTMLRAIGIALTTDIIYSLLLSQRSGLLRKREVEPLSNKAADFAAFALGNYMGRRWSGQA